MLLPKRLSDGNRLKIIFPASSLKKGRGLTRPYNYGVGLLEKHFELEGSRHLDGDELGFAGSDDERAKEIIDAVLLPKIHGLIAGRGGYGCLRILTHLDFEVFRNNPKVIVGCSDLTILQSALYAKIGLISFSGPLLITLDPAGLEALLTVLCMDTTDRELIPESNRPEVEVLNSGSAEGVLLGGNLFSLVQLIGTGFLPRLENCILFFEDVDETVDHLDSFLMHLKLAGQLYGVQGVVIGDTSWRETSPLTSNKKNSTLFRERIKTLFRRDVPIIVGVRYGHCDDSITIPFGAKAKLDADARSIKLLQEVTVG